MNMSYRILAVLALAVVCVTAETHRVSFQNRCAVGGTPTLVSQNGQILSTGGDFTSNGPLVGAIAYFQTGSCGLNGDGCTLVETTLRNPPCSGCGSSTDISLIPPHTYSVAVSFEYRNGCDGAGASCNSPGCNTAFHEPTDNAVQVACQENDVNLVITFCI